MKVAKAYCAALILVILMAGPTLQSSAIAQGNVTIGAVQALKGVFSEAFVQINDGLKDSLAIANSEGGVNGKTINYAMASCEWSVPDAKAKFDQIMSNQNPLAVFGCSTGMSIDLAPKITKQFKILYGSTSYSAKLSNAAVYPSIFLSGPTYGEQLGILALYIARAKPKARVAFFYSDTAFGKDPIAYGRILCRRFGLTRAGEVVINLKDKDVTQEVEKLRSMNPDFVIFQGFVLNPVPEVIKQCRALGMTCKFMGTFWGANKKIIDLLGPLAEGYLAVNPFAYWNEESAPMIQKIRSYNATNYPEVKYRPNYYMQGFATGLVFVDVLKRADKAGQLNYEGMVKALQSTKDLDTGGLTGPWTIKNNRFPVARVYQADTTSMTLKPVSDWLQLK